MVSGVSLHLKVFYTYGFIRASPRLKDASLPPEAYPPLYRSLILTIRRMFHACHLVHADLSEYNILFHNDQPYIIDVSQSVEHDHPHAFDFLRSDIKNVEEFFGRYGVRVLGIRRSFEFVTKEAFSEDEIGLKEEDVLERWLERVDNEPDLEPDSAPRLEQQINSTTHPDSESPRQLRKVRFAVNAHEDAVFMQSYIPRTLNEVYDPERDVDVVKKGQGKGLIYADTIGLVRPKGENGTEPMFGPSESESDHDEEGVDEESESGDVDGNRVEKKKPRGHRHEDKEAKKERKKAVKEGARERRKNKMTKSEKKMRIKTTRH